MNLGDLRWPLLSDCGAKTILAITLGATEQYGPHLPLDTDTVIATELCHQLAQHVPDVLVAPAVPYGSSGEHAGFPGTLSIGQTALELLIVELVRSADHFAGVILVSGHGGNVTALHTAQQRLAAEGRIILVWHPTGPPDDSHTETSVMLHLRPDRVALAEARPGDTRPLNNIIGVLRLS